MAAFLPGNYSIIATIDVPSSNSTMHSKGSLTVWADQSNLLQCLGTHPGDKARQWLLRWLQLTAQAPMAGLMPMPQTMAGYMWQAGRQAGRQASTLLRGEPV